MIKLRKHLFSILIIILILTNISQFIYFYKENQRLGYRLDSQKQEIDYSAKLMKDVSVYFEGKGNLTIQGLLETYQQLQSTIKVYDNNVDILNKNAKLVDGKILNLQGQINDLRNSINRVITYLQFFNK